MVRIFNEKDKYPIFYIAVETNQNSPNSSGIAARSYAR